jgi:hypothetical protein
MKRSLVFSNGINGIFELGFLGNLDGFPFFSCHTFSYCIFSLFETKWTSSFFFY